MQAQRARPELVDLGEIHPRQIHFDGAGSVEQVNLVRCAVRSAEKQDAAGMILRLLGEGGGRQKGEDEKQQFHGTDSSILGKTWEPLQVILDRPG